MGTGGLGAESALYHERGYLSVPAAIAPDTVDRLRAAADALPYQGGGPYGSICHNCWRHHPDFAAAIRRYELGSIAASLLELDEVVLFQDHLISKPAGGSVAIAWHQDYSYWPLDRPRGMTMWIALDDVAIDGGCLVYVPGSHTEGERRPADFALGAPQPPRAIELEPISEAEAVRRAVPVTVSAGDLLVHDPLVWHQSGPNQRSRPRRAWSLSWIDPKARWQLAHSPHPFVQQLGPADGDIVCGDLFRRY